MYGRIMTDFKNGFEYLKKVREKSERERATFDSFKNYLDYKAREKGIPIEGQFELTPLCNFDCRLCFVHLTKDQLGGRHIRDAKEWKEVRHRAWKAGMIKATLTGGECLAYPGFKEIYLYLHSLGCEVTVLTNGYLIDDEWIEFFKAHRPAMMRITLYGHDEDSYERVTRHRGFERVKGNIRRLQEAGIALMLSFTPNRYLGGENCETYRTARSLCDNVMLSNALFEPREETGRSGSTGGIGDDAYLELYRLRDELDGLEPLPVSEEELPPAGGPTHVCSGEGLECGGGRSGFCIDWKGQMHPCTRFYMIGADALGDGFEKAWRQINQIVTQWPRTPECEGCAYEPACIRCAAYFMQFAKPGKQPLELCERVRYYVKNGVWRIPECDD